MNEDLRNRTYTSPTQSGEESMTDKARESAGEYGQKAQEGLDKGIQQSAAGMDTAAEKIREKAEQSDGMPAQAGVKLADGMERAAGYLREHDSEDMMADLERYVRSHPTTAVAGALVAGLVIGKILR